MGMKRLLGRPNYHEPQLLENVEARFIPRIYIRLYHRTSVPLLTPETH